MDARLRELPESSNTSPSGSRASKFHPVSQRQPGSCCGQLATATATDARQRRRAHERENPSKRTIKNNTTTKTKGARDATAERGSRSNPRRGRARVRPPIRQPPPGRKSIAGIDAGLTGERARRKKGEPIEPPPCERTPPPRPVVGARSRPAAADGAPTAPAGQPSLSLHHLPS